MSKAKKRDDGGTKRDKYNVHRHKVYKRSVERGYRMQAAMKDTNHERLQSGRGYRQGGTFAGAEYPEAGDGIFAGAEFPEAESWSAEG